MTASVTEAYVDLILCTNEVGFLSHFCPIIPDFCPILLGIISKWWSLNDNPHRWNQMTLFVICKSFFINRTKCCKKFENVTVVGKVIDSIYFHSIYLPECWFEDWQCDWKKK